MPSPRQTRQCILQHRPLSTESTPILDGPNRSQEFLRWSSPPLCHLRIDGVHEVVSLRINIQGFIVFDCIHKAADVTDILTQAWKDGKIGIGDEVEAVLKAKFEDVKDVVEDIRRHKHWEDDYQVGLI